MLVTSEFLGDELMNIDSKLIPLSIAIRGVKAIYWRPGTRPDPQIGGSVVPDYPHLRENPNLYGRRETQR